MDINSNCSRVDAVKASADRLKLQLTQVSRNDRTSRNYKAAESTLQTVDAQIHTGDSRKAELALSSAENAIRNVQSSPHASASSDPVDSQRPGHQLLDTYA